MLDVKYHENLGHDSIIMSSNSTSSKFCINFLNNILDTTTNLMWDDIGNNTVKALFDSYPNLILFNEYKINTNENFNFIKNKLINSDTNEANQIVLNIINNPNCYYVPTWSIDYIDNYNNDDNNLIVEYDNSISYHLIKEVTNNYIFENRQLNKKILYTIIIIFLILSIIIILINFIKQK
jgi:hypothetical protein